NRKSVDNFYTFGALKLGQALGNKKIGQFAYRGRGLAWSNNEIDARLFAVNRVGHGHELGIEHSRMFADKLLDFLAADFLAAPVDVVAQAAFKAVIRFALNSVGGHDIAGAHESIRSKCGAVGFGRFKVTPQRRGATKTQLSHLPRFYRSFRLGVE